MNMALGPVKVGELLLITTGAYSSYEVHTLLRVTADAHLGHVLDKYLLDHPEQRSLAQYSGFIRCLVAQKIVEEVPYRECFLGYHRSFDDAKLAERTYDFKTDMVDEEGV